MSRSRKTCLCGSAKAYKDCCRPLHRGELADSALALMRSRYSAYALQHAQYIVDTTHPSNKQWRAERQAWIADILVFCRSTAFEGLEVLECEESEDEAYVTFVAQLRQGNTPAGFRERSRFVKVDGQWLYIDGDINPAISS